ncbi:hypothetical protein [Streptomyces mirabilis]|uniref:hypothetical protein n=1 Tax=Streptomyces mirabilis TaxID=68239 RepID=UPI0036E57BF9
MARSHSEACAHWANATAAEPKDRWRALERVTLSPNWRGDLARAALVLNGNWK